jgi:hypothetical protein
MISGMLSDEAHAQFSEALSSWGMADADIEDTLRWATFCPGLVDMKSDDPEIPRGLGIVVDESEDEELARLFALRERLDDDEFLADWEVSSNSTARVVLDPTSPQAMLRYAITIERPERIERRFLFLVHALAPLLAGFQRSGTQLWLIPRHVAMAAPDTLTAAYEVISDCLPVGLTREPLAALDQALAHVTSGPSA